MNAGSLLDSTTTTRLHYFARPDLRVERLS